MANEITLSNGLDIQKGNLKRTIAKVDDKHTLTGSRVMCNTQLIGTSEETLYIGDLTSVGAAMFRNLDATNFIEIGVLENSVFRAFLKLDAGKASSCYLSDDSLLGTPPNSAIYAKADTASALLEVTISEV